MRGLTLALRRLHVELGVAYGPQGWWPLPAKAGRPGFDEHGYHPANPGAPVDAADRFAVALGAVLTQNTAWTNAERALEALAAAGVRRPANVLACSPPRLARLVRPSGSYTVKARKLRHLAAFFAQRGLRRAPAREELLAVWGVGPETADSILLYAFGQPVFVVDAYTRRLLTRMGLATGDETYGAVQGLFHRTFGPDAGLFNECHALIVRHAKEHCRATARCAGCPVSRCRRLPSRSGLRP